MAADPGFYRRQNAGVKGMAMKAYKGEKIVCKCPQPAGEFHRDVDDRASISNDDIAIRCPSLMTISVAMSVQRAR